MDCSPTFVLIRISPFITALPAEAGHRVPELPAALSAELRSFCLDGDQPNLVLSFFIHIILGLQGNVDLRGREFVRRGAPGLRHLGNVLLGRLKLAEFGAVTLGVVVRGLRRVYDKVWDYYR